MLAVAGLLSCIVPPPALSLFSILPQAAAAWRLPAAHSLLRSPGSTTDITAPSHPPTLQFFGSCAASFSVDLPRSAGSSQSKPVCLRLWFLRLEPQLNSDSTDSSVSLGFALSRFFSQYPSPIPIVLLLIRSSRPSLVFGWRYHISDSET